MFVIIDVPGLTLVHYNFLKDKLTFFNLHVENSLKYFTISIVSI